MSQSSKLALILTIIVLISAVEVAVGALVVSEPTGNKSSEAPSPPPTPPTPAPHDHQVSEITMNNLRKSCYLIIASGSLTLLLGTIAVFYYRKFWVTLQCIFNDLAISTTVSQMLQSIGKITFAVITLVEDGPLSAKMCDISATIDQFFDPTASMLMTFFFFTLAYSRRYTTHAAESFHLWLLLSCIVGAMTVVVCWVFLYPGRTVDGARFTQGALGWCWIPQTSAEITHVSTGTLRALRFFGSYLYSLLLLFAAVFAFVRLRCIEGGVFSWDADRRVIYVRFFSVIAFPAVAYGIGFVARFADTSSTVTHDLVLAVSFMFPVCGAVNAIVFLYTEGLVGVFFCQRSSPHPNGFAQIVNSLTCQQIRGQVVPSGATDVDNYLSQDRFPSNEVSTPGKQHQNYLQEEHQNHSMDPSPHRFGGGGGGGRSPRSLRLGGINGSGSHNTPGRLGNSGGTGQNTTGATSLVNYGTLNMPSTREVEGEEDGHHERSYSGAFPHPPQSRSNRGSDLHRHRSSSRLSAGGFYGTVESEHPPGYDSRDRYQSNRGSNALGSRASFENVEDAERHANFRQFHETFIRQYARTAAGMSSSTGERNNPNGSPQGGMKRAQSSAAFGGGGTTGSNAQGAARGPARYGSFVVGGGQSTMGSQQPTFLDDRSSCCDGDVASSVSSGEFHSNNNNNGGGGGLSSGSMHHHQSPPPTNKGEEDFA